MNFELEDIKPEHFDEINGQISQEYFKNLIEKQPKFKYAKVLGFKPESILKSYGPDGHDHVIFTIINRSLEWETQ